MYHKRVADMPADHSRAAANARVRARRRAEGLTSIEAVLHQEEIASLDRIKAQLGFASRSEVLRVLIAKTDPNTITPADAAALAQRSA